MDVAELLQSRVDEYLAQIPGAAAIEALHEHALAKSWREHGDPEAERRLVSSQLRLVAEIAWRYRGYGLRLSGLIHEGNRALMDAVRLFDPDSGWRLATYAGWQVEAALVDYVLASWPQVRARTSAEKMKLFLDLCGVKARLTGIGNRIRSQGSTDAAQPAMAAATDRPAACNAALGAVFTLPSAKRPAKDNRQPRIHAKPAQAEAI
jgi:hypothetical protein